MNDNETTGNGQEQQAGILPDVKLDRETVELIKNDKFLSIAFLLTRLTGNVMLSCIMAYHIANGEEGTFDDL